MTRAEQAPATDRLAAVHARLVEAVDALVEGTAWRQMLDVAARFHRYSPNNVMLILLQRPDATRVAGYHTWRELDRHVRKGEKGIAILAPLTMRRANAEDTPVQDSGAQETQAPKVLRGFRVTHVFDVNQTEGAPLPDVRPELLAGSAPFGVWDALMDQVEAEGYEFGGYIDLGGANGLTDHVAKSVTLRPGLSDAQMVKTLAHELAHVSMHSPDALSAARDVAPAGWTRERIEVEAESVAHLICASHGLDTGEYTVPYVAAWAGGNRELVEDTARRVLTTARDILGRVPPRDDGTVTSLSRAAGRTRTAAELLRSPEPTNERAVGRAG
jgi:antirestriction protein ArdC